METIHGAPSFVLRTPEVELAVTRTAGHLAPVRFHLGALTAAPYSLSPWTPDQIDQGLPNLLVYLRGDFLCLPFGGQEKGPPHGDVANADWTLVEQTATSLSLRQVGADTGATVTKTLSLVPGHHAVYAEHRIENLEGRWNYGNHPVLDLSGVAAGTARIATSAFRWGSVYPAEFSNPAQGESGALRPNARFTDLTAVPTKSGQDTDLTRYPARPGHDDLIMLVNAPATEEQPFAWTAVTFPGYVWFQLKDVADFPATLFWLSNGGRPGHPWEKRHLGRLGLEEVCSHFCDGVAVAREDRLAADGVPTSREFRRDEPVRLAIIQGAVATGASFGQVRAITPVGSSAVRIRGENGQSLEVPLNWGFLKA
jgi:hypothetical protein